MINKIDSKNSLLLLSLLISSLTLPYCCGSSIMNRPAAIAAFSTRMNNGFGASSTRQISSSLVRGGLRNWHHNRFSVLPNKHRRTAGGFISGGEHVLEHVSKRHQMSFITTMSLRALVNNFETSMNIDEELGKIEEELYKLNDGARFNLSSPKQVSNALFPNAGVVESTSKAALEAFIAANDVNQDESIIQRKKMAATVLQWRALRSSKIKQEREERQQMENVIAEPARSRSTRSFSSFTKDQVMEGEKKSSSSSSSIDGSTPMSGVTQDSQSQYAQHVDSLFDFPKSQIDAFWQDVIRDGVNKPSAKKLVYQLKSACPMGYDPLATAFSSNGEEKMSSSTQAGKRGSLLAYVREQKCRFPNSVILTRVGEFYESFGIDAVALVQYCGLNPMGGKARAGCPVKNIQATCDGLTQNGFQVAVYEEAADTDSLTGRGASGGSKSRLKNRMLAQVVSPASPTYLFDLVLANENNAADALGTSQISRPYMGIIHTSAGYTMVEISVEERTVRVSERVTGEAVACRLAAYPPADPLIYVPTLAESLDLDATKLSFLPSRSDTASHGPGSRLKTKFISPHLVQEPTPGQTDVERAKRTILSALLDMTHVGTTTTTLKSNDSEEQTLSSEDFILVSSAPSPHRASPCMPLYKETAAQLGLMSDPTIPPLVSSLLPDSAPVPTRRFLRRWLLIPPPPDVADAMSSLVGSLKEDGPPLPPLHVPPIGKVLALIRAAQASAQVFRELMGTLDATISVLLSSSATSTAIDDHDPTYGHAVSFSEDQNHIMDIIGPLMILIENESGMAAEPTSLRSRCTDAMQVIDNVIRPQGDIDPISVDCGELIPRAFFERNEMAWRGRVRREAADMAYTNVEIAVDRLVDAVAIEFGGNTDKDRHDAAADDDSITMTNTFTKEAKGIIVQDIFNNIFALKAIPSWVVDEDKASDRDKYYHPRDRNGKILRNRYTTEAVDKALSAYVQACDDACKDITASLTQLSETLCDAGHLPTVVQAAHANLLLSTAAHHAASANAKGWSVADAYEESPPINADDETELRGLEQEEKHPQTTTGDVVGNFQDVWPYWMDRSDAVPNSFLLDGLFILTAPNMSGKSTLMRSTAAAALLSNCGLCAPVGSGSWIRRFDSVFVRGASTDVPTEGKSAFGAEMGDVAALFRSCAHRSLVFVDELGRGTSPRDGTSLAGAVLEAMAKAGMSGFFATHLHGILKLPLQEEASSRIKQKRMAVNVESVGEQEIGDYGWTYKLENGVCRDSLALKTAARFGLPQDILDRAEALSKLVEDVKIKDDSTTITAATTDAVRNGSSESVDVSAPTAQVSNGHIQQKQEMGLNTVLKITERVANGRAVRIPPKWMTPASFEGCACVYVLEVGEGGGVHPTEEETAPNNTRIRNSHSTSPPKYYVGETDSLARRLSEHRAKGKKWASMSAVAVKVEGGKSNARNIESRLIRQMSKLGYDLISVVDGRVIRSLGNNEPMLSKNGLGVSSNE